jgi:methionyl-tRNA formyltransferase
MVTASSLRVVFMGTPAFALPTFDALLTSSHRVVAVVTQPDRPRGRGQKATDAPVKQRALEAGVPVMQPGSLKDAAWLETFSALHVDLGVVAAYGKILPESLLSRPPLGMINVHASLLPKYRGAAPIHRAVAAGEHETGVTIMRIVKALDAGPMLATVHRTIEDDDTSVAVERDLGILGAQLLVEIVDRLAQGPVREEAQDDRAASYAPRLTREEGVIDWVRPAPVIHNLVRGMQPWPMASTTLDGRRFILHRTRLHRASGPAPDPEGPIDAAPGTVLSARGDALLVATGEGILQIDTLQAEGRRVMSTREFLAGHKMSPGHRFSMLAS